MLMMMKSQHRTDPQPRHLPLPEWNSVNGMNADKGRKHEAFETSTSGSDRRSQALAQRCDRKR